MPHQPRCHHGVCTPAGACTLHIALCQTAQRPTRGQTQHIEHTKQTPQPLCAWSAPRCRDAAASLAVPCRRHPHRLWCAAPLYVTPCSAGDPLITDPNQATQPAARAGVAPPTDAHKTISLPGFSGHQVSPTTSVGTSNLSCTHARAPGTSVLDPFKRPSGWAAHKPQKQNSTAYPRSSHLQPPVLQQQSCGGT